MKVTLSLDWMTYLMKDTNGIDDENLPVLTYKRINHFHETYMNRQLKSQNWGEKEELYKSVIGFDDAFN